jgi:hypothetical protein
MTSCVSAGWTELSVLPTIQRLICRISNRVSVGAHLYAWFLLQLGQLPVLRILQAVYNELAFESFGRRHQVSLYHRERFPEFLKPCSNLVSLPSILIPLTKAS